MQLRYYQIEAKDSVIDELIYQNRHSTLLVMATASGKTVTFAHIIKDYINAGKRVLVLAHREELIQQAHNTISDITGLNNFEISIEKSHENASLFSRVVIASVQSLKGERLRFWRKEHFSLIIIDEAHHTPAEGYLKIIEHFNKAKILGVTATPKRLDKKGLGQIYDSVAYIYDINRGIKDGYLSKVIRKQVIVEHLDLSKVRKIKGDFKESDLEKEMVKKPTLYEVAKPIVELSENRPTIVFCVTVEHAKQLSEILNVIKPESSKYLSAKDDLDTRREVLEEFRSGKIQYLCNCLLFTEGVDLPFVSCIACARPTQSETMYTQFIGRGLRICEGKDNCLVIDFTDNSARYNLVTVSDILEDEDDEPVGIIPKVFIPKEEDKEEIKEKEQQQDEENGPTDLDLEKQRALQNQQVRFQVKHIDPFQVVGIYITKPKLGGIPPTEKQKAFIERHGLWRDTLTRRQASMICQKISERLRQGICSPGQARILAQFGFNPNYSRTQAELIISELKNNGWKLTKELENKASWEKVEQKTKEMNRPLSKTTKHLVFGSIDKSK
jgi:superfamily II DNA or RNA helicase